MPAIRAAAVVHETNMVATRQVEITAGHDNVVRVNVDGVCALRIRCEKGCHIFLLNDAVNEEIRTTVEY